MDQMHDQYMNEKQYRVWKIGEVYGEIGIASHGWLQEGGYCLFWWKEDKYSKKE